MNPTPTLSLRVHRVVRASCALAAVLMLAACDDDSGDIRTKVGADTEPSLVRIAAVMGKESTWHVLQAVHPAQADATPDKAAGARAVSGDGVRGNAASDGAAKDGSAPRAPIDELFDVSFGDDLF
jgi:hypothetical protein